MKKFNIWGSFTVDVDFEIDAENEKEAEEKAKKLINDTYYLDAVGGLHVSKSAGYKLYADEED